MCLLNFFHSGSQCKEQGAKNDDGLCGDTVVNALALKAELAGSNPASPRNLVHDDAWLKVEVGKEEGEEEGTSRRQG